MITLKKKKSKKKIIIIIIILLLLILLFLWWWFNRKFDVTFKYNNGLDNETIKVRYNNKIKDEDVKKDLTFEGHSFIGYFETYYLSGKEIEKIKEDKKTEESICKKGFKLNQDKDKCIANEEFDFKNTRIKENKTIEAFWSGIIFDIDPKEKQIYVGESFDIKVVLSGTNNKDIMWSSEDGTVATVTNNGKVTGVKKGTTTINVETNGLKKICKVTVVEKEQPKEEPKKEEPKIEEPKKETPTVQKDEGKISISTKNKCIIGDQKANVNASITGNALNKTITWTTSKCYSMQKVSGTSINVYRNNTNGCNANDTFKVNAKLNNGSNSSVSITYEPQLTYKVYDRSGKEVTRENGVYYGNDLTIKTSSDASFECKYDKIQKTSNSVYIPGATSADVTITTPCGQKESLHITAIIN